MTSLSNLTTVNTTGNTSVDNAISHVFDTLFDNREVISIGSFVRKVYALLMGLCDVCSSVWVITLRYDTKQERFRFIIKNVENSYQYEVICTLSSGVNYACALDVVNKSFIRDKMAKHAVSYIKTNIIADTNDYIYEKKLLNDESDIAVWTMRAKSKPWYKRLFSKTIPPEKRTIKSIKVIDYNL